MYVYGKCAGSPAGRPVFGNVFVGAAATIAHVRWRRGRAGRDVTTGLRRITIIFPPRPPHHDPVVFVSCAPCSTIVVVVVGAYSLSQRRIP